MFNVLRVRLENAYSRPTKWFFFEFNQQSGSSIYATPNRHLLARKQRRTVKICLPVRAQCDPENKVKKVA